MTWEPINVCEMGHETQHSDSMFRKTPPQCLAEHSLVLHSTWDTHGRFDKSTSEITLNWKQKMANIPTPRLPPKPRALHCKVDVFWIPMSAIRILGRRFRPWNDIDVPAGNAGNFVSRDPTSSKNEEEKLVQWSLPHADAVTCLNTMNPFWTIYVRSKYKLSTYRCRARNRESKFMKSSHKRKFTNCTRCLLDNIAILHTLLIIALWGHHGGRVRANRKIPAEYI